MKDNIRLWLEKKIKQSNQKKAYIHFDKKPDLLGKILLSKKEISPQLFFEDFFDDKKIANRAFWPFIHFIKTENRYKKNQTDSKKLGKFEPKNRPIYYASYFDSYIFSFYNYLLGQKYEELLNKVNIHNEILAYRHIKKEDGNGGKNNIHFAKQIFKQISDIEDCYVFAFDISKFFEHLDWEILDKNICNALGLEKLSDDWRNIFNSITNYSYIDKNDILKYNLIKNKIIDTNEFHKARKKYKQENPGKNLVKKTPDSKNNYGIAQGTPISGLMANLYMYDFDVYISNYVKEYSGKYYRYSDDILLIIPYTKENKENLFNEVQQEVFCYIKKLKLTIQQKKTDIFDFKQGILFKSFTYNEEKDSFDEDKNTKNLQYLGFSFDGNNILLRDKTLTRHYRRMVESIKKLTRLKPYIKNGITIRKSRIKGNNILLGNINKRYSHSGAKKNQNKYGNFYGYVINAISIMNDLNKSLNATKIKKQMSKYQNNYQKILKDKKLK